MQQPIVDREAKLTHVRLGLLTGASLIAPMCILLKELHRGDFDLIVIVCASIVLFGLVVMRMADLVRQQERSVGPRAATQLVRHRARVLRHARGDAAVRPRGGGPPARGSRRGGAVPEPRTVPWRRSGSATTPTGQRERSRRKWPRVCSSSRQTTRLTSCPCRRRCSAYWICRRRGPAGSCCHCRFAAALPASSWSRGPSPPPARCGPPWRRWPPNSRSRSKAHASREKIHLQRSEARFASLVQHSSDLITVVGSDATIVYQSPSSERVLGYPPRELDRHALRPPRGSGGRRAAPAGARGRIDLRATRRRGHRVHAAPPRRRPAPVRDPAHEPAR